MYPKWMKEKKQKKIVPAEILNLCLSLVLCLFLQVRKELEACGIELYPQKEFDEDMEDKSDNDKIRVSKDSIAPDSQLDIHTQ